MPVAWLAVFTVIAVALVKIAFIDGMKPGEVLAGPSAEVAIPVVQATRATVTNAVQVKATVQSDAPVGIRNTTAGVVTHFFLAEGQPVTSGDRIYQVRTEVVTESTTQDTAGLATAADQAPSQARQPVTRTGPVYTYADVLAPATGRLESLTVLLNQQVGVGEAAGTVNPGTFTVSGSIDAAQQYRLLAKPGSAEIAVVGGPAPFSCPAVALKEAASGGVSGNVGGVSGGVSRTVPYAVAVPGGGSGPEQGGAPTGTVSCAVPSGVEVFAGLGAAMTVTAGQAADVVTVPLTSVRGSVKEGSVWLAPAGAAPDSSTGTPAGEPAGEPQERKVQLGLNDGSMVEIVSGLAEGEAVLEFIPGAPARQAGEQYAGPGSIPAGG